MEPEQSTAMPIRSLTHSLPKGIGDGRSPLALVRAQRPSLTHSLPKGIGDCGVGLRAHVIMVGP